MGRLREIRNDRSGLVPTDVKSSRTRGDALSDAAYLAKRRADALLEQEFRRGRMLAGFAGGGGLLALAFGFAAIGGFGQPLLLGLLAALAMLAPTAHALAQSAGGQGRIAEASYERGFCQALAMQAKRFGDTVGATDERNLPLGPEAIVNGQLDLLFKDLDRSKQRLLAAGAAADQKTAANRLHERIVPETTETYLRGSDGRRYPVRITDVSQSGVAIKGNLPSLYQNEHVQIGVRRAKIVKVGVGEVAALFLIPILPSEFNKKMIL